MELAICGTKHLGIRFCNSLGQLKASRDSPYTPVPGLVRPPIVLCLPLCNGSIVLDFRFILLFFFYLSPDAEAYNFQQVIKSTKNRSEGIYWKRIVVGFVY